MQFIQLSLSNFPLTPENEIELDNLISSCKNQSKVIIYISGDVFQNTVESLSQILFRIYGSFFSLNRFINVCICFSNEEHPILRIPDLREILSNLNETHLTTLNQARRQRGLGPLSVVSPSSSEFNLLSSLDSIIKTLTEHSTFLHTKNSPFPLHKYVAVGGTFDRLHPGHKVLLTVTSLCASERVHVGLTCDELLQKKKNSNLLQSYVLRRFIIRDFIQLISPSIQLDVDELHDPIGPVDGSIPTIDCLVVSEETKGAIPMINEARKNKDKIMEGHSGFPLKPLQYVIIPLAPLQEQSSSETKMSSTFLREADQTQ